jgi:hypothetical protein
MHQTAKVLYRPPGRTEEILLYHIDDFAELAHSYRREVDRMVVEGEIEKVKWRGVTLIPAEFLSKFNATEEPDRERPERGKQQTGGHAAGPKAETEYRAEVSTPWEELSYEARQS